MARTIQLPPHLQWSGYNEYDLDDDDDLAAMYSVLMAKGKAADIRQWVDRATVVRLWDRLVLPRHVENAWRSWLEHYTETSSV